MGVMKLTINNIFIVLMLLALTACGFKLRGLISSLPFETIYIAAPLGNPIGPDLERAINSSTTTSIVRKKEDAEAILHIISATNDKRILSLSGGGDVREFELIYRLNSRLVDTKGKEIIPANEIVLTRILPFLNTQVLAKLAEEKLLYENMQQDAVQQLIWRLAALKPES
jgi:LPS-assembly lipoprotein